MITSMTLEALLIPSDDNPFKNATVRHGYELPDEITYFGKKFKIKIRANSYLDFPNGATVNDQQIDAYNQYMGNKEKILKDIERCLAKDMKSKEAASKKYKPAMLIIERNGNYGMLFDDTKDPEEGIVVTIKPSMSLVHPDVYL